MKFKKINKKILVIFLLLVLMAGITPGIVIGIVIPKLEKVKMEKLSFWSKYKFNLEKTNQNNDSATNKGWDSRELKRQIEEEKNFIVYFGSQQCPACQKLTTNIQKNIELVNALENGAKKQKQKYLLYLYYTNDDLDSSPGSKRDVMNKAIKNLFDELGWENWKSLSSLPSEQLFSFPTWFFFKDGKLVEIIDGIGTQEFIKKIIKKIGKHY